MTMTSPLPTLESTQLQELGLHKWLNAVSAYKVILQAEALAIQDEANENIISARVAGYLLLELYARRGILGDQPCATVIDEIMSPSQDGGANSERDVIDVVFEIGRWYQDRLIRACAFDYFTVCPSFNISVVLKSGRTLSHTPQPRPHALQLLPTTH
jgi:hypothetical protein